MSGNRDVPRHGIIGYDPSIPDIHLHYALISLVDGMIAHCNETKTSMAKILNAGSEEPVECFKAWPEV